MGSLLLLSALFIASLHIIVSLPAGGNGKIKVTPPEAKPFPVKIPKPQLGPQKKPENNESDKEENRNAETEEEEGEEDIDLNGKDGKDGKEEIEEDKGPETEEEKEKEKEAELNPILFEGDLKLSKAEIKSLKENTISKRDAIASEASKWPNGRVPYILSPELARDRRRVILLRRARIEFKMRTCIRLTTKKKNDKDYIKFIIGGGCYSDSVGKKKGGGEQIVSIGPGCTYNGLVLHEIMHALGFFHEHTRPDRDQYVTVEWKNIQKDMEGQFMKYGHGEADYLNEPYDYDSVMHYPRDGFGVKVNGTALPTLIPKDKPWRVIGQRRGFSAIDLRQINKLYKCKRFTSKY